MIQIVTFGFKYGMPNCNYLFDVTFLPNPARGAKRRLDDVLTEDMKSETVALPEFEELVDRLSDMCAFLDQTGMEIRLGIGCNSGQHRSRIVADALVGTLNQRGIDCRLSHRE